MFSFNWPLIIVTTVVLYILTIIFLPFNAIYATVILFSLIAFWSRLPGVCIYEPISLLYLMDFVDIFSIIIAIHINPVYGASFSFFWNLYPRLAGGFKEWPNLLKDAGTQSFVTLLCPIFFAMTGSLEVVVVIYSVLRLIIFWLLNLVLPTRGIVEQTIRLLISGTALLFINILYAKLFGDFFSNLMKKGASFSWVLFFVATVVILLFSILVMGFSPKNAGKNVGKQIRRVVRKQVMKKEDMHEDKKDDDEIRFIRDSINKDRGENSRGIK